LLLFVMQKLGTDTVASAFYSALQRVTRGHVSLEHPLTIVDFVLFRDSLRGRSPRRQCRTFRLDCLGALRLAGPQFVLDHGVYPGKGYYFQHSSQGRWD